MDSDLKKLQIDKGLKARRRESGGGKPFLILVVLVLLGGGALGWFNRDALMGNRVPTVEVTTVVLPTGTITESDLVKLSATGYIVAAHKIEVASKVVGRVAWVGIERGDKVAKDQVLVRLEDDEYKARVMQQEGIVEAARARLAEFEAGSRVEEVAQSKAAVDQAQVELENAELNFKRYQDLMPTRSVSRQQLDDAASDVRAKKARLDSFKQAYELVRAGPRKEQIAAQRANVKQMEGGLAMVRLDLENTIIKSPIAGTILARNVEVGEFVTTGFVGDQGAKGYVVSMADLEDLRVELDISQDNFAKTYLNQACWITTDAYRDRKYDGQIDLISPEANRTKATVQVRVKVLKPDSFLRPDMNATVSFLDEAKLALLKSGSTRPAAERPAIRIPSTAIVDGAVYVVQAGKVVKRPVSVGDAIAGEVEIKRGLIGGEDILTRPGENARDGLSVRIAGQKN